MFSGGKLWNGATSVFIIISTLHSLIKYCPKLTRYHHPQYHPSGRGCSPCFMRWSYAGTAWLAGYSRPQRKEEGEKRSVSYEVLYSLSWLHGGRLSAAKETVNRWMLRKWLVNVNNKFAALVVTRLPLKRLQIETLQWKALFPLGI